MTTSHNLPAAPYGIRADEDWKWTILVVVTVVSILVANCSIAHLYYTKQSNERLTDEVRRLQETP